MIFVWRLPMNIIICDDNQSQLDLLTEYIKEWAKSISAIVSLIPCHNDKELFFHIEDYKSIDIIILDIEMPGMNGMDIAKTLRKNRESAQIIFLTGYVEYACEGYQVEAIAYLLKPMNKVRLFDSLNKAVEKLEKEVPIILIEEAGITRKIEISTICYLESQGHNTDIVLRASSDDQTIITCKKALRQLSEILTKYPSFYPLHRSYIINMEAVNCITKKEVLMDNDAHLPIPRGKWEDVNKAYINFYRLGETL